MSDMCPSCGRQLGDAPAFNAPKFISDCETVAPAIGEYWTLRGGTRVRIVAPRDERIWARWPDGSIWPTDMSGASPNGRAA